MQNGARYQAVLEILTEVFADKQPADKIVADYLRARKYIGAKDRRFISDLVWQIIRNRLKLEFDAQSNEVRRILLYAWRDKLTEVFDGSTYGMAPLSEEEKAWLKYENDETYPAYVEAECPEWLFEKIGDIAFCKALNLPASVVIRAHGIEVEELKRKLKAEGIAAKNAKIAPKALKIDDRLVLNNCMAWQDGWFDVQDESSQIAIELADVRPEHKIIDYCCGAGGKTLAMSNNLQNQGHILAYDIDKKRLEAIGPRLARLKVKNVELTDFVADSDKDFDRFILDAPCSGTGTWRRAPDAKFRLTAKRLAELCEIQGQLLELAARKTKIGGRIVYMTCSVLREENENVVERFLAKYNEFEAVDLREIWTQKLLSPYPCADERFLRLAPLTTDTDGFFTAILERKA